MTSEAGCGTHASLGTELRAVAVLLLDRFAPVLDRAQSAFNLAGPAQSAAVCASCPVCAVLAMLRGERPELAARLAEHASGLLDVLASALAEPEPSAAPAPDPTAGRRVQYIRVERPEPVR